MTERVEHPRGTLDWLPPRVALRQHVIDVAIETFERAGFRQIVTPVFEDTALFARTAGETSDVVSKEMYTFHDRSDRSLTLRPEGTAPVVRAYLEHGLSREPQPVRLWYVAPMYRYAAPQAGRYREHYQFGVEALGSDDPAVDAEVIALQAAWYRALGLTDLGLHVNSIGDPACRPAYREALVAYFEPFRDRLSPESQERLHKNPMRILDSKDERDQQFVAGAPRITEYLCADCREHLEAVRAHLTARGVEHLLDDTLVRGLDYYTRTAWEWIPVEDGRAQATISGGGRYDGLAEQIGGKRTPGVGFGCGIERLVLALEKQGRAPEARGCDWFVAVDEPEARPRVGALLDEARANGLSAEMDLAGRSLKGQLRHARRLGARVISVIGPDEWSRGVARLRDDAVPLEDDVPLERLVVTVEETLMLLTDTGGR
jgi:histidyl-tRNA synthetase